MKVTWPNIAPHICRLFPSRSQFSPFPRREFFPFPSSSWCTSLSVYIVCRARRIRARVLAGGVLREIFPAAAHVALEKEGRGEELGRLEWYARGCLLSLVFSGVLL